MPLTYAAPAGVLADSRPVAVFSDGGIIDRNPSAVGGTWAFAVVDEHGALCLGTAGHVTAAEVTPLGPAWVSNNFTEVLALLLGFESLPAGWSGRAYSDSKNAISAHRRAAEPDMPKPDYLPRQVWDRMVDARGRLGPVKFFLLGGHPTAAELLAGRRKDGAPVSEWNVWCDRAATEAGKAYLRSIGRLPEKKAAKPKADLVSRADVLDLVRTLPPGVVPTSGFDFADWQTAAAFGAGRLAQYVIQKVEEMPRTKR